MQSHHLPCVIHLLPHFGLEGLLLGDLTVRTAKPVIDEERGDGGFVPKQHPDYEVGYSIFLDGSASRSDSYIIDVVIQTSFRAVLSS